MNLRELPPAGTPISPADLFSWLRGALRPAATMVELGERFGERCGGRQVFFLSTGRAAMVVLLRALHELAGGGRDEVVVPSYTCYSVPSSVSKAGLRVRIVDIDPATLDYDYEQLARADLSGVVAVVSNSLYGLPGDLPRLAALAEANGVRLVDDAAQALGATVDGRQCGTFGTAGIYSLDKGKVITSMNGGIIVTDSEKLARTLNRQIQGLPGPSWLWTATEIAKLLVYSAFLKPSRYWLPARLPFLGLGGTAYTTDYPLQRYCTPMGGLALRLLERLEQLNGGRRDNGAFYRDALTGIDGITLPSLAPDSLPIYLRFPLLARDSAMRERILGALRQQRLGASGSYPASIGDLGPVRELLVNPDDPVAGGRGVAERIVTLPTHPLVTAADRAAVVETIREAAR
ncbi:DegT/DnrJ/EryC1/StrS family aminotransferase [bacterium]|nr:DegT/DnrJ/EryC1/StrS family aminotransferase [bacterium]